MRTITFLSHHFSTTSAANKKNKFQMFEPSDTMQNNSFNLSSSRNWSYPIFLIWLSKHNSSPKYRNFNPNPFIPNMFFIHILQEITNNTYIYAVLLKKEIGGLRKDVTAAELKCFLEIHIYTELFKCPRIAGHWDTSGYSPSYQIVFAIFFKLFQ